MSQIISSIGQGLIALSGRAQLNNSIHRLNINRYICLTRTGQLYDQNVAVSRHNSRVSTSPLPSLFNYIPCNTLYSAEGLGMDRLERLRQSRAQTYEGGRERYLERIGQYIDSGNTSSIFRDDLINMIALADHEKHLDLIEKLAKSIKEDKDNLFGSWGSALMRLYYKMNQIERAYNNLKDEDSFGSFFNQRTSYQIAMTMLYDAGRYPEVIEIYELSRERLNSEDAKHPSIRMLSVVAFASLAKMNTPEALEKAEELFSADPSNQYLKMRVISFLAYLAVNHNKPTLALNLISDCPGKNYISLREIKLISLIKLKRYEDVLHYLRETTNEINRDYTLIFKEIETMIKERSSEIEDETIRHDLLDLLAELRENKLIGDDTLESLLFRELGKSSGPVVYDSKFNRPPRRNYNYDRSNDRDFNRDRDQNNYRKVGNYSQRNQFKGDNSKRDFKGDRGGRNRGKSYFEEDSLEDFDEADVGTEKRFR